MASTPLAAIMGSLPSPSLRVLAVAQRTNLSLAADGADITASERSHIDQDMHLLALIPPTSRPAMAQWLTAGNVVRMLTYDRPAMAAAIAAEIGIILEGIAGKGVVNTSPKRRWRSCP